MEVPSPLAAAAPAGLSFNTVSATSRSRTPASLLLTTSRKSTFLLGTDRPRRQPRRLHFAEKGTGLVLPGIRANPRSQKPRTVRLRVLCHHPPIQHLAPSPIHNSPRLRYPRRHCQTQLIFCPGSPLLYKITFLPGTPASNRRNRYRNGRAPFSTVPSSNR